MISNVVELFGARRAALPVDVKITLLSAGLIFLLALVLGVWKYRQVLASQEHRADLNAIGARICTIGNEYKNSAARMTQRARRTRRRTTSFAVARAAASH